MKIKETIFPGAWSADYVFLCPGCNRQHGIKTTGGGAWTFDGDMDTPTISPSILAICGEDRCHSFVRAGKIEFLSDCTHDLAGQTVDLPEIV